MIEKQLRYNSKRSSQNPECNEWFFFIINQNREISQIRGKIFDLFSPIIEEYNSLAGNVPGTGLRYFLMDFESTKKVEDYQIKGLYKKVAKDENLYSRSKGDIEIYLSKFIDKKK